MTKIGSNIKKIRTIKNISQQAFADIFNLSRGNISSYEESRAEPKIEVVIKIANYFSIPLEQFISRSLTVNEILKFNGDKLIEDENHINNLQLAETPFINENIYLKCTHGELSFRAYNKFPKLILPESSHQNLIALTYNPVIPHHIDTQRFSYNDILVFVEITEENIHLCADRIGLFIENNYIHLGKYNQESAQKIILKLNELKHDILKIDNTRTFWKLRAVYRHEE